MKTKYPIEITTNPKDESGKEITITAMVTHWSGSDDVMYLSNGDPGYPGYDEEYEIYDVVLSNGQESIEVGFDDLPDIVQESMVQEAIDKRPCDLDD